MSNTKPNIDYVQLCKALEERDKTTAQNLILNNVNVETFNASDRYNWANIIYEALEISLISKVLQEENKVIVPNLLLDEQLFFNVAHLPEWKGHINTVFHILNMFRRLIRGPVFEEDEVTAEIFVLTPYRHSSVKFISTPQGWVNIIFTALTMFSKVFHSKELEQDDEVTAPSLMLNNDNDNNPNASEFHKWVRILSETLNITTKLLGTEATIHARNHNNYELLNVAIQKNNTLEACLFIRRGAFLEDDFIVLLLGAIEKKNETVVKVLVDHGMQYNPLINLSIPLYIAIVQEQSKIIEHIIPHCQFLEPGQCIHEQTLLLLEKAKTHAQTSDNALIFDTIKNRFHKIAQLLLNYNVNIQYISPDGNTPLHKAIENDFNIKFIKTLLKLNSPVDAVNHKMLTPLLVACKTKFENQLDIVNALVQYNANVNCADLSLMTPLHFACQARNLDVVTVLLKNGANLNAKNHENQTPLHVVCGQDIYNISTKDKNDKTPNIIKLLLEHNADIEAVDSKGWTPLFVACKAGRVEVVQCLLENHANTNHSDLENLNPLYIAAQSCHFFNTEVVELLLECKTNVHCINKLGKSIIHHIIEQNAEKLIKKLAYTEININSVDNDGNTPLHIAIKDKSVGATKTLLKYGADINILNKKKRTPLRMAIESVSYHRNKLNIHDYIHQWCKSDIPFDEEPTTEMMQELYNALNTYPCKQIVRILKLHVTKLKAAGLRVNEQNSNLFHNSDTYAVSDEESSDEENVSDTEDSQTDVLQLEIKCAQEIESMKMEKIGVNDMTFYDLLTKNIHLLNRWVKNKKILEIEESSVYAEKFPLYVHIFRSRFRDAKFRRRLVNPAIKYFRLKICHRFPDDCIDTVFSYLKIKDIHTFIRAMKSLDG